MCEIIHKHSQFFRLELYTFKQMTEEEWKNLIMPKLLEIEMALNATGEIRAHIHEEY